MPSVIVFANGLKLNTSSLMSDQTAGDYLELLKLASPIAHEIGQNKLPVKILSPVIPWVRN